MSYDARVYNVIIASPGDVKIERDAATEIIHEWNTIHSEKNRIVLIPRKWETDAYSDMGNDPQTTINNQYAKNADLLIGIFWSRLGTKTKNYPSGTIEEIEEHLKAGKPAMLYISNRDISKNHDRKQLKELQKMEAQYRNKTLIHFYNTEEEFRRNFTRQLAQRMCEEDKFPSFKEEAHIVISPDNVIGSVIHSTSKNVEEQLSDEEIEILVLALQEDGVIQKHNDPNFHYWTLGNLFHDLMHETNSEEQTIYLEAFDKLIERKLINNPTNDLVNFHLTKSGWEKAKEFKDRKYDFN